MRAPLATEDIDALARLVGERHLRTGEAVAALEPGWAADNLGAGIVVEPADTGEVAAVVRHCARRGIGIVPHGGRTGLVGGGISKPGEIVLSTRRLTDIAPIEPTERVALVGAGVTLESLQTAAAVHGLEPGIDLAARGSATIGGMISTNAGGVMAFRHGVMRHRVLGLEAVMADGSVLSDLSRVVKCAAGYDVKQLLIGGEGTLGIVTRAALKLEPMPSATATAMLGLPSTAAALAVVAGALADTGGMLRAGEVLWRRYLELTAGDAGWSDPALDMSQPVFLLLAVGGADETEASQALHGVLARALAAHPGLTGLVASSERQARALWHLREHTDAIYRRHAAAPSFDVSVPIAGIEAYLARVEAGLARVDATLAPYVFGHLCDGNIHIALDRAGPLSSEMQQRVEDVLYGGLTAAGGSFSAEHGVGLKRTGALAATADPIKLALMRTLKAALDPAGIMNPGKVLALGR